MVDFDLVKTCNNPIHAQNFASEPNLDKFLLQCHIILAMAKDKKKNADTKKAKKVPSYLVLLPLYLIAPPKNCPSMAHDMMNI
jgi:hypothetical protein